MRDWVTNLYVVKHLSTVPLITDQLFFSCAISDTTYFLIGSPIGPHPFPTIVRDFQKVIGKEIKAQLHTKRGKLPDAIVACVGGGSNAIGSFHEFIQDESVRLVGCEAGGDGMCHSEELQILYVV